MLDYILGKAVMVDMSSPKVAGDDPGRQGCFIVDVAERYGVALQEI